jgi:uncharacterized repeat protein (TIGR01451 family)
MKSCSPTFLTQNLKRLRRYAAWTAGGITLTGLLMGIGLKAIADTPGATNYQDPLNYPGTWPTNWTPYTTNGISILDFTAGGGDATKGATPSQSGDIAPCAGGSALFSRDANNLYFRLCVDADPYVSTASSGPYTASGSWTLLIDVNGDGFREFAVFLDGKGSQNFDTAPDDLYVVYKKDLSQSFTSSDLQTGTGGSATPGSAVLWVQDSAIGSPTRQTIADGETGWPGLGRDLSRTRTVDRGDGTYYLDIQVPLAALDATSKGGPKVTLNTPISFVFATATSNTDPYQKDIAFPGTFSPTATVPLPFGDIVTGNTTYPQPGIPTVTAGACSAANTLSATILDSLSITSSSTVGSSITSVKFFYQFDSDGDSKPDPTGTWMLIGNGSIPVTVPATTNPWQVTWNSTTVSKGLYFIKAVAVDNAGYTTDSLDAIDDSGANTVAGGDTFNPATLQTTPTASVFASFSNTCGKNPPTIDLDGNNSSGATGNDFKTTFTLAGSAVGVVDANTPTTETLDTVITDTDSTYLSKAVINLANAQTGDALAVNGALPPGITRDPSSTATQVILLGDVTATLANFETALEQIRFSTTSGSLSDRMVTVQLTDNTNLVSNVATTTISITGKDFGDAPNNLASIDTTLSNIYPSASHTLDGLTFLGDRVDAETANQPTVNADGDDSAGSPSDEDGVTFPLAGTNRILNSGQTDTLTVKASRAGILNAWIDWNQDGDWNDPGEQIATDTTLVTGNNTLTVAVPKTAPHGATYARFRFSTATGLGPTGGPAINGEVEDYKINIVLPAPLACASGVLNNGFEEPVIGSSSPAILQDFGNGGIVSYREADVPWWGTVATSPSSGSSFDQRNAIEMWKKGNSIQGNPFEGNQFAEINAYVSGQLYQDLAVPPGTQIRWQVAHRGRGGTDTLGVFIGVPGSEVSQGSYATPNTEWRVYSGLYIVPAGQYITRFGLRSMSTAGGNNSVGNFVDDVRLSNFCAPTVKGYKSVKLTTDADSNNKISPGDTLTYTLFYTNSANNNTGPAAGFQINDPLPTGLTITAAGSQMVSVSGGNTSANINPSYTGATTGADSNLLNPGSLLDVGGVIRVDIPVKVDATASGTLFNQGTSSALEFSGQNVKTDNADNTNTGLPISIPVGSVAQTQTSAIDPTQVSVINSAVSSSPNLILVKRITAVRGGTTTMNGDDLSTYNQDNDYPYDDNLIEPSLAPNPPIFMTADTDKWPNTTDKSNSTFLIGGRNGGATKPGDEVEYTIYFLSAGTGTAKNVTICDRIPAHQTFVPDVFNSLPAAPNTGTASAPGDRGIAVFQGSTTKPDTIYGYTNIGDGDAARYYPPGSTLPSACTQPALAEDNGSIVVNLGDLPNATNPGTPKESYGFLRFRAKVK